MKECLVYCTCTHVATNIRLSSYYCQLESNNNDTENRYYGCSYLITPCIYIALYKLTLAAISFTLEIRQL